MKVYHCQHSCEGCARLLVPVGKGAYPYECKRKDKEPEAMVYWGVAKSSKFSQCWTVESDLLSCKLDFNDLTPGSEVLIWDEYETIESVKIIPYNMPEIILSGTGEHITVNQIENL